MSSRDSHLQGAHDDLRVSASVQNKPDHPASVSQHTSSEQKVSRQDCLPVTLKNIDKHTHRHKTHTVSALKKYDSTTSIETS